MHDALVMVATPLLEREAELDRIGALLAAADRGDGTLTVLEGPAGIGKTRLLAAAREAAEPAGLRTLRARAAELERAYPFGVARQLLEPPVLAARAPERDALLGGPAGRAAGILGLDSDRPDGPGDAEPSAALHGLFWLVANLAADGPLLVTVDDLQWADEPSLRLLAYLAHRLEGLPVAVVATLRTGTPVEAALDALLSEPGLHRMRPAPLSARAVAQLIEKKLGEPPEPAFAEACRRRTAGNPFLLAELGAELADRGVRPTREAAAGVQAVLPDRVASVARRRLTALGRDAQAMARALVVLGDGVEPGLAGALAGLDAQRSAAAAAELIRADLLEPGTDLGFRHPLLRAAFAATAPQAALGSAHARAARLLTERGAGASRIAAHLLASPPGDADPWAVERLRAAARAARRQGAPQQATALLRRALAEPATAAVRPGLLRELGHTELMAMERAAIEHLNEALVLAADPAGRSDVALDLAIALYSAARYPEAVDALLGAIGELDDGEEHRERRLRLEAFLAIAGRYDLSTEARLRGRVHELAANLDGATPGERLVLAVAALQDPGPSSRGLARAARLQERVMDEAPWSLPSEGVGTVAMYLHAGRPEAARALADGLLERARSAGSPARYALALFARAAVHLDLGALAEAEADFRDGIEVADDTGMAPTSTSVGMLVAVLAERGELTEAQALLARHALEGDVPEQMILNPLLHARATLRLAQGRWTDAAADALELGRRHELWRMRRPSPNWRALAAEALRAGGDPGQARALADASLEIARAWDTPKALAIALRARALTRGGDERRADLEEAMAGLAGTPWRLEAARVGVDLGAALRRAGERRAGRDRLAEAMDVAHRCGARTLAERAAEELRAAGARPRRHAVTGRDAITPSERRVAVLAAEGRANREIAQALFVTVATVETHLSRAYRKLGVSGRGELAGALALVSRSDAAGEKSATEPL